MFIGFCQYKQVCYIAAPKAATQVIISVSSVV